jgi:hypothetical protein
MTLSARQVTGVALVAFCMGAVAAPVLTEGQATQASQPASATPATPPAGTPTYMLVQFMKVAEGKEEAWIKLERETWKPLHALRVKDGGIKSWAVIAQAMPGDESNGPTLATVTTFRGWPDPTKTNWTDLMKKAHPQGNADSLFQQTDDARRIVRSEVWQVLDQMDPGTMAGTK